MSSRSVDDGVLSVVSSTREVDFDVTLRVASIWFLVTLFGKLDLGISFLVTVTVRLFVDGKVFATRVWSAEVFSTAWTRAFFFVDVDALLLVPRSVSVLAWRERGFERRVAGFLSVTFPSDARSPRR